MVSSVPYGEPRLEENEENQRARRVIWHAAGSTFPRVSERSILAKIIVVAVNSSATSGICITQYYSVCCREGI
jgi:hypothetical protein